ncbi:MAG: ATP-binding protein [Verrucomicrobiota bacterium]
MQTSSKSREATQAELRRLPSGAPLSSGPQSRLVLAGIALLSLPLVATQRAQADLSLTEVEIDNRSVPLASSSLEQAPIRISSDARSLIFHFTEVNAENVPTARLRYKLEGYDTEWKDLHPDPEMRINIQFSDAEHLIVGTATFDLIGQTPGWKGTAEDSDFQPRKEQTTVPARAVDARLLLYSSGGNSGMGIVGIDDVRVSIHHPKDSKSEIYDWSVSKGTDLDQPLGTPSNWRREGSRAEMAQLRTRKLPTPHPILIVHDDDPTRIGIWSTDSQKKMPVRPGDRMTVEWKTAHSIGSGGPGQAQYRNLKPGRYWFRVSTASASGEPTGREISLPVEVVAPYFQRPEFWIFVVAMLGGATTLVTRWVIRNGMQRRIEEIERLHALERERTRIARDLHDDIGGGLTEIAMQSDWVRRDLVQGVTPDTLRRIERVNQSAMELTRSVDEIVWAVNPANDTLDRFATYLSQSTEQYLNATKIRLRLDFPPTLPPLPLPGKVRHGLFMAVREALHNAAKHSNADTIRLCLELQETELVTVVEDNGRGFSPELTTADGTHDGLENMRRRMIEIGGALHLRSELRKGSRLEFRLPLVNNRVTP